MPLTLSISPHGRIIPHKASEDSTDEHPAPGPWEARTTRAFAPRQDREGGQVEDVECENRSGKETHLSFLT
jgi:hypothetical protein